MYKINKEEAKALSEIHYGKIDKLCAEWIAACICSLDKAEELRDSINSEINKIRELESIIEGNENKTKEYSSTISFAVDSSFEELLNKLGIE